MRVWTQLVCPTRDISVSLQTSTSWVHGQRRRWLFFLRASVVTGMSAPEAGLDICGATSDQLCCSISNLYSLPPILPLHTYYP